MTQSLDSVEQRITQLRIKIRRAFDAGDQGRLRPLRAELDRARLDWDTALGELGQPAGPLHAEPAIEPPFRDGPVLLRECVQAALLALGVPASPKLIVLVDKAFGAGSLSGPRMASLRRDELRAYQAGTGARAYICNALTFDRLTAARGPHALSTWPLHQRIIGPHSAHVDRLTATVNIAARVQALTTPNPAATQLLAHLATWATIPEASCADPSTLITVARTQLDVHQPADLRTRHEAAQRVRDQHLTDQQLLFGR
ncbi:hypothetical protein [Nocardia sp. IFM 10818]